MAAAVTDPSTSGFFAGLPLIDDPRACFDAHRYRPAPDDWALAVTDIVDSTGAIANGQHKTVNFVAAMGIAALRNLCAPTRIPFLFGGDGAVVMVPPERIEPARVELARVRGTAQREFQMTLRAGLVVVNVNPQYTAPELEHQLKDSGAAAVVVLENFAHTLQQVLDRNPALKPAVIATA